MTLRLNWVDYEEMRVLADRRRAGHDVPDYHSIEIRRQAKDEWRRRIAMDLEPVLPVGVVSRSRTLNPITYQRLKFQLRNDCLPSHLSRTEVQAAIQKTDQDRLHRDDIIKIYEGWKGKIQPCYVDGCWYSNTAVATDKWRSFDHPSPAERGFVRYWIFGKRGRSQREFSIAIGDGKYRYLDAKFTAVTRCPRCRRFVTSSELRSPIRWDSRLRRESKSRSRRFYELRDLAVREVCGRCRTWISARALTDFDDLLAATIKLKKEIRNAK